MTEYLDIIDDSGVIIGRMSREEAYKKNCALQVSGILLFRSNGNLILQRRGKNKKYPLCYDYSAAGHVLSGESFLQAAHRELEEELGITNVVLAPLGQVRAYQKDEPQKLRKLHTIFHTICDAPIKIYKEELDGVDEFLKDKLDLYIKQCPEKFTPTFIKVYNEIILPRNLFARSSVPQQVHKIGGDGR